MGCTFPRSGFSTAIFPADFRREFCRRSISQAAVRTRRIVIHPPRFDGLSGFVQAHEPVLVQAFVPEFPVETFDERILHRLARLDEMQRSPRSQKAHWSTA